MQDIFRKRILQIVNDIKLEGQLGYTAYTIKLINTPVQLHGIICKSPASRI